MGAVRRKETKHEIPDDLSIPDFLRRAVAEARQVIKEMETVGPATDEPKLA